MIQWKYNDDGPIARHKLWTFRIVGVMPTHHGGLGVRETELESDVPDHLNDPAQRTRFYAGQPDPNDPSHFTIGYAVNDQLGTIDGWLHSGSIVELKVRDGPATQPVKMKHVVRAGASSR